MCLLTCPPLAPASPPLSTTASRRSSMKSSSNLLNAASKSNKTIITTASTTSITRNASAITASSKSTAHGQMLRKRYFQAIGIFQERPRENAKSRVVPVPLAVPSLMTPPKTWSRKATPAVTPTPTSKPFKFQPLSRRTSSMSTASTCTTSTASSCSSLSTTNTTNTDRSTSRSKKVSFSQAATSVVQIPSRHAYSADLKRRLWISCEEMRYSYSRNVTEFRFERWNWRQCVEEHDFVNIQGQLVHPVHVYLAAAAQQEQLYHLHRQQQQPQHRSNYGSSSQATNLKNHFYRVMSAQQRA